MYCVKCKRKTKTKNKREEITKNGRKIFKGTCAICNTKKNMFGGSILTLSQTSPGFYVSGVQVF